MQPISASNTPQLDVRERRKRRREGILIVLLSLLFVILTVAEFRLTRASSTLPFVNSIFFFGLLNINIVLLMAMVWLVFRNIGKLYLERRRNILGSRLKTKLVIAFLAFSIIPTLTLFVISATYINSSFDKWFSLKIQNTLQASLEITRTYYRNTDQTAMHFAEHLAETIGEKLPSVVSVPSPELESFLAGQRELLALDAVEFYSDPLEERILAQRPRTPAGAEGQDPSAFALSYPRLPLDVLDQAFAGERRSIIQHIGSGDLIRCLVPVRAHGARSGKSIGVVVVSSYIPVSLVNKVDEIANVFDDYKETNPLKYPMKTTYLVILVMITLVIIFVAMWIGLYLARQLTVPVERLVYGAQAVGAGDLDVSIVASGHDEITVLVESFNNMTRDLRESRARLVQAGADLERRRLQLEAVLANIGTGVVAIDSSGTITTFNHSAELLLEMSAAEAIGQSSAKMFAERAEPLLALMREARERARTEASRIETQWNFRAFGGARTLKAIATSLRENDAWGIVLVIDDMTHLMKGQREMAWREVARRIAHEIKNPLTPIKLSAQRLQRRLGNYRGRDGELLQECTDTIIKHSDELKEMVNEFSNFARFPEISPAPNDLNAAIGEVVSLFQQAHAQIHLKTHLEAKLPVFEFDRDQIKRVVINLFDNAVAALAGNTQSKQLTISTHYNEQLQMAVIEVEDNGPGMSPEVLERAFEPYFSTKTEGTGLGLAICKRIVNDHDGFIRVHSVLGKGTRFLIELPSKR
ncbi:MAG: ATP-binding protein [Oligoflexia bacterium]|nr:ATP-binding protein [Oligoflexia bacterium]